MVSIGFTVEADRMQSPRLRGHFQASGGFRNDIQVVICGADEFINFNNGHQARVFYNSGKSTVGSIDVALPDGGGKYVLVLDNRFSLLSAKTITGDVALDYVSR